VLAWVAFSGAVSDAIMKVERYRAVQRYIRNGAIEAGVCEI
jgi:hypothetical protein